MIQDVFRAEGPAARSRLRAARRKRVQEHGALARERQGHVAVHARHGARKTASSRTGSSTSGPIPKRPRARRRKYLKSLADDVRRRLEPGARQLQRRARARRARDEALEVDRLLEDVAVDAKYLPRDTREYVPMILAADHHREESRAYGFEVAPPTPPAFEKVTVPGALDLRIIAEWAGTYGRRDSGAQPGAAADDDAARAHELKVPMGTAAASRPSSRRPTRRCSRRSSSTRSSAARRSRASRGNSRSRRPSCARRTTCGAQRACAPARR